MRAILYDTRCDAPYLIPDRHAIVGSGTSIYDGIIQLQEVVKQAGQRITRLEIHCHGFPGFLQLGTETVHGRNVADFGQELQSVMMPFTYIDLQACLVAVTDPDTIARYAKRMPKVGSGTVFCTRLAQAARCHVLAADRIQVGWMATHQDGNFLVDMGNWEGNAYDFSPSGQVTFVGHNAIRRTDREDHGNPVTLPPANFKY